MQNRKEAFRDYDNTNDQVKQTYKKMQRKQTLKFVKKKKRDYTEDGINIKKRFSYIFKVLDKIVDESDPDNDLPQIFHAYQTGEALRQFIDKNVAVRELFTDQEWQALPIKYQLIFSGNLKSLYSHIDDWSWLPLVGFLHDCGKVLAAKKWGELPQWAVVGDTFPVGAPFSKANVYSEFGFFKKNKDLNIENNKKKKFGRYKKHCGFENVHMSFGHDEYLFSVLNRLEHQLPEEALYIIRFHSFYPWHSPRDGERGYRELASDADWMRLPLLKAFQKSDLYSKSAEKPDVEKLKAFYFDLLEKYIPSGKKKGIKVAW